MIQNCTINVLSNLHCHTLVHNMPVSWLLEYTTLHYINIYNNNKYAHSIKDVCTKNCYPNLCLKFLCKRFEQAFRKYSQKKKLEYLFLTRFNLVSGIGHRANTTADTNVHDQLSKFIPTVSYCLNSFQSKLSLSFEMSNHQITRM